MYLKTITRRGITFFLKKPTQYTKPILLLFGAPGVGKGTYGRKLSKDWNMPLFSTGEYLRDVLAHDNSAKGNEIRAMVQRGKLVDNETVYKIVEHRMLYEEEEDAKGIILDSFPKNVEQAKMLHKLGTVHAAMNFFLSDAIIIEKLAGRRECEDCHTTYNVASIHRNEHDMDPIIPTHDPNRCDFCGGELVRRYDDDPLIVSDKLEVYRMTRASLENYYKNLGVYIEFSPKRGIKDYYKIKTKLEEFLKSRKQ